MTNAKSSAVKKIFAPEPREMAQQLHRFYDLPERRLHMLTKSETFVSHNLNNNNNVLILLNRLFQHKLFTQPSYPLSISTSNRGFYDDVQSCIPTTPDEPCFMVTIMTYQLGMNQEIKSRL